MEGDRLQLSLLMAVVTILALTLMLCLVSKSEYSFAQDNLNDAFSTHEHNSTYLKEDPFGVAEIYPTADGGREWYVNMSNPQNSSDFSETGDFELVKQNDGSWRVNSTHV